MDFPTTLAGWANALGLIWQITAYAGASLAALKLFSCLKSESAPRPFCVIAATTRCVIGRRPSGRRVEAADMLRLGALGMAGACMAMAALSASYLLDLDWRALGQGKSLLWVCAHIAIGSALMISLTGAERLIREGSAHGA